MDEIKKRKKLKWWQIILVVLLVLVVIGAIFGKDDPVNPSDSTLSENGTIVDVPNTPPVEPVTPPVAKFAPSETELSNGHFTAGIDFPAGTYDITAVSGSGNVSSSNMFSGGLNAIMGTEVNEINEQEYKNIDLSDGVVLSINGVTVKIASQEASTVALTSREQGITETVKLGNGNFTAGKDFKAGIYDVVAVKGSGNVSSSNMFEGGLNAIMGIEENGFNEKEYKNINLPTDVILTISGVGIELIPSK